MSLAIDQDHVTRVLIGNEWHTVDPLPASPDISSFYLDAYEIGEHTDRYDADRFDSLYSDGTGFSFLSYGHRISGPITSIQAITTSEHTPAVPVDHGRVE